MTYREGSTALQLLAEERFGTKLRAGIATEEARHQSGLGYLRREG